MKTTAGSLTTFALLGSWIGAVFAQQSLSLPDLADLCKPNSDPGLPQVCRPDLACRPGEEEPVTVIVYNYTAETTATSWVHQVSVVPVIDTKTVVSVSTDFGPPLVICKPTQTSTVNVLKTFWATSTTISYNLTTSYTTVTQTTVVSQPSNPDCVTSRPASSTPGASGSAEASPPAATAQSPMGGGGDGGDADGAGEND